MNWIPVDKQLPPQMFGMSPLVVISNKECSTLARYNYKINKWVPQSGNPHDLFFKPTHWLEIPKLPKSEKYEKERKESI